MSNTLEVPPVVITPNVTGPITFMVVGAGGTGARLIPPLMQLVRPNDRVLIYDPDIVKDRNLTRQHFTERDIGIGKAEVLARRYARGDQRPIPYMRAFDSGVAEAGNATVILIGCSDNYRARYEMASFMSRSYPTAHVDGGNSTRDGQVIVSLNRWPALVSMKQEAPKPTIQWRGHVQLLAIHEAMPQLLRDGKAEADESCENRIDLQTVQVNVMSAAYSLNAVSNLMLNMPMTTCGAFFSTYNTSQPIKLIGARLLSDARIIVSPETTFAVPE